MLVKESFKSCLARDHSLSELELLGMVSSGSNYEGTDGVAKGLEENLKKRAEELGATRVYGVEFSFRRVASGGIESIQGGVILSGDAYGPEGSSTEERSNTRSPSEQ